MMTVCWESDGWVVTTGAKPWSRLAGPFDSNELAWCWIDKHNEAEPHEVR